MKKTLVVLTGAGISAESGISTFRDSDGLWENYNVEDVATIEGWKKNKQLVLDFYNQRRKNMLSKKPNVAHIGLAELEEYFNIHIITQNVDSLHEQAGSTNVLHLHGEISKMRSSKNPKEIFPYDKDIAIGDKAPDGSQLRPHIVWFGEDVPNIPTAMIKVKNADILVVIGTSMQVYPAASLIQYASLKIPKYVINKSIPDKTDNYGNMIFIEKPATEGIQLLKKQLIENI